MKTAKAITATFAITVIACSAWAQGSLTPPGAPAATMKTLEQVEPRIDLATVSGNGSTEIYITNSGSYYLSANLEVTKLYGISVDAMDVMLDLNGFEIYWVSGNSDSGIKINSGMDMVTVRNGTITGFDYGVRDLAAGGLFDKLSVSGCRVWGISAGASSRVIDCRAINNSGSGIQVLQNSVISGCAASGNQGDYGIRIDYGSSITDCTVSYNHCMYGIYAEQGSSIKGCESHNNIGTGVDSFGIYAASNSTINECVASRNMGAGSNSYGIFGDEGSSIHGCAAYWNESSGFFAGKGSSVNSCSAYANEGSAGIFVEEGSIIKGCSAYSNTGSGSFSYGIRAGEGSSVVECTVRNNGNTNSPSASNQGVGIYALARSNVRDCTISSNQGDGIWVVGFSLVKGNLCSNNGDHWIVDQGDGAGIHSTGTDNRIEGNTVLFNDRNIDIDGSYSLIIRNRAHGDSIGTNYVISANNKVGPVVVAPDSAGISGSTGGAGLGSTDPWANLSF